MLISLFPLAMTASESGKVQTVLCVGDSITAADNGWVKRVGQHAAIDTINAGLGGRRTGAAVETFEAALTNKAQTPFNRVIFFLGVNDLPARDPAPAKKKVDSCVANMEKAIDAALKRLPKKDIILIAPCGVNAEMMRHPPQSTNNTVAVRCERNLKKGYDICQPILEDLETAYRKMAEKKGVQFLSLLKVVSKENYMDGLHPDEAGQRQLAEAITSFLLKTAP
jgi:lysophospholipase L1-like esterase